MIYKYTKCESVIAKILADSNMSEKEMRITDMREWIFEAIDKIGAPMQYIQKESGANGCPILKIEDYQVPMPSDMVHLNAVAYSTKKSGQYIPVRSETGQFKEPKYTPKQPRLKIGPLYDENNYTIEDEPLYIKTDCQDKNIPEMKYKIPTAQCQFYTNNLSKYSNEIIKTQFEDVTFFTKPGWIVLNKKTGYVKLSYKSIAVDERGYPLIPDSTAYQEAVYWYVMMKLNFPKYLKGKLGGATVTSNQNVYFYLQGQWNFYRNQAYAEAMMPTESDMRSIKNEWNKLVPEWDSDDTFFGGVGKRQLNYNDYYYGYQ